MQPAAPGPGRVREALARARREVPRAYVGFLVDWLVSYAVYVLEDESPPPGEVEPRRPIRRLLFRGALAR